MDRRSFLRTLSLAAVGGIFVPKYERWFRPAHVWVPTAETNLLITDAEIRECIRRVWEQHARSILPNMEAIHLRRMYRA